KDWQSNREDKRYNNQPFTRVQLETPDRKLLNADLLNSLPKNVLKANGWSDEKIQGLRLKTKKHNLSHKALQDLGVSSESPDAYFFGKGAYGTVKFARIYSENGDKTTWCAAKKIQEDIDIKIEDIEKEIRLQIQSGVAPTIHGMADTCKSNNSKQKQYILFMDPLKGQDGFQFLKKKDLSIAEKFTLAANYTKSIKKMHKNGVFHGDFKVDNSAIDPETLEVQVLDFGLAGTKKLKNKPQLHMSQGFYMPPEMVKMPGNGITDMEKVDVYSLGVVFSEIFQATHGPGFIYTRWNQTMISEAQSHIDIGIAKADIKHSDMKSLIKDMTQADPKRRPTMQEVTKRLASVKMNTVSPAAEVKSVYDWQRPCLYARPAVNGYDRLIDRSIARNNHLNRCGQAACNDAYGFGAYRYGGIYGADNYNHYGLRGGFGLGNYYNPRPWRQAAAY
ncbi:MAG: protein kinase domain-containing protein, partial [Endozoicomonas sp.]